MNEQDRKKLLERVGVAQYKATKQRLKDGVKSDSERMAEIWDTPPIPTMVEIDLTEQMLFRHLETRIKDCMSHEFIARYDSGDIDVIDAVISARKALLAGCDAEIRYALDARGL